jgi:hypothetical protein
MWVNKEGKGDKYGWSIFYTCMNMEHWNHLKSFQEGGWEKEINGGEETGVHVCIHGNVKKKLIKLSYTSNVFKK